VIAHEFELQQGNGQPSRDSLPVPAALAPHRKTFSHARYSNLKCRRIADLQDNLNYFIVAEKCHLRKFVLNSDQKVSFHHPTGRKCCNMHYLCGLSTSVAHLVAAFQ
jgi:hypothetical protein